MKQKLLFLFFSLLISTSVLAQVVADQVDDFEDGTTQGWKHKLANPWDPENVATDGPAGVDDNYLSMGNSGNNGLQGARHIMSNTDSRWSGNFTSAGILAIRMNVRNPGSEDLHLRVAFRGGPNITWIYSTTAVVVPNGSGWITIEIPITATDFSVASGGSDTAAEVLADVSTEMRILSNDGNDTSPQAALYKGDLRVQTSNIDNIRAATSYLNTKDNKLANAFSISPNPGRDRLNLKLSKIDNNSTFEVFDVLGKKIYADRISTINKSVDVSQWNNGVYLVRLISDKGTQTKRFVKQ